MENKEGENVKAKKVSKNTIPTKSIDLANLGVNVSNYWATQPQITLVYITQPEFATIAVANKQTLEARIKSGETRPQISSRLKFLDAEFNSNLKFVKGYILEKYNNADPISYFQEFGILSDRGKQILPNDRSTRNTSLKSMVPALEKHGFANNTYGKAWWEPRILEYQELLTKASEMDSKIAETVDGKNNYMAQVERVLKSLVLVLKGNYDTNYASVLRAWGFQKEKF